MIPPRSSPIGQLGRRTQILLGTLRHDIRRSLRVVGARTIWTSRECSRRRNSGRSCRGCPVGTLASNKLSRTFEFQDFVASLSFINSLVAYFETADHHPDVLIAYGEVTFTLTRYDVGGKVTDRDVEVAKKISSAYQSRS